MGTSIMTSARLRRTAAIALAALLLVAPPAGAADPLTLRGDVVVGRDTLTLGDLVANAPPAAAATPVFRAPGLGQTGTIQVRRIAAAAEALGLAVETGGRFHVTVARAARHIGPVEIESALRKALAKDFGLDPNLTGIRFDRPGPALVVEVGTTGEIGLADVVFDRRDRRVTATVWIGPSANERLAQLRVSGNAVDLVEVAVLGRSLERGEAIKAADITIEQRPRDGVASDTIFDNAPTEGRIARRALAAGSLVRPGDLIRPEIVARGDIVTVIYQAPGISLALRAKATDAGALGDTVGIVNPQSKKALQAIVIGPGRVSVSAATPGRVAAAAPQP